MKVIQIALEDNVAVALCPITAGDIVVAGVLYYVEVLVDIPQGLIISLKDIYI